MHIVIQHFIGLLGSSWSTQISFFMLLRSKTTNSISPSVFGDLSKLLKTYANRLIFFRHYLWLYWNIFGLTDFYENNWLLHFPLFFWRYVNFYIFFSNICCINVAIFQKIMILLLQFVFHIIFEQNTLKQTIWLLRITRIGWTMRI